MAIVSGFRVNVAAIKQMIKYIAAEGRDIKGEKIIYTNACLIRVHKQNLLVQCMDKFQNIYIETNLKLGKKGCIKTGGVPIQIEEVLDVLRRFRGKDEIKIIFDGNMIEFTRESPYLFFSIPTITADDIESTYEGDTPWSKEEGYPTHGKIALKSKIVLDAQQMAEVIKDGEQILNRTYPFEVTQERVLVTVRNEDTGRKIAREIVTKSIETGTAGDESLYANGFGNVFSNLSGEITIFLSSDQIMYIEKTDPALNLDLIYILASAEIESESETLDDMDEIDPELDEELDGVVEEEIKRRKRENGPNSN